MDSFLFSIFSFALFQIFRIPQVTASFGLEVQPLLRWTCASGTRGVWNHQAAGAVNRSRKKKQRQCERKIIVLNVETYLIRVHLYTFKPKVPVSSFPDCSGGLAEESTLSSHCLAASAGVLAGSDWLALERSGKWMARYHFSMDDRCKSLMAYHRDRLPDFSALNVVHSRQ